MQGFQVLADTNSGFGSMALLTINYFLKDEAPKAPVYLYSINNSNKFDIVQGMNEDEITNLKTRQELMDIN